MNNEQNPKEMKKCRTLKDVENHPLVKCLIREYDGKGCHMVELKEGYNIWDASTSIGNAAVLIDEVNYQIQKA